MDGCSEHKGRLYDLCTGIGHDGRPNPTQEACDRFRDKHGKDKIEVQNPSAPSPERNMARPTDRSNVGTLLAKIFKEKVGAVPCSACKQRIASLNQLSVPDIISRRAAIVAEISQSAAKSAPKWWQKAGVIADQFLGTGVTSSLIGSYLDMACAMASTIEPQPPTEVVSVVEDTHRVEPPLQKQIAEHTGVDYLDDEWCVVVTTAPRKGEHTLSQCLQSLIEAGWTKPIVFAEPGSTVPDGIDVITNEERRGCFHNWLHSARWALKNSSATVIMCVQDDAVFHPDSKDFVEQHCLWPNKQAAFVSLYTPKHYSEAGGKARPVGINRVVTAALWGTLAVVWRREVLDRIVNSPAADQWLGVSPSRKEGEKKEDREIRVKAYYENRKQNPHTINNSDYFVGNEVNKLKLEMYFVDPSPVRHIAKVSTIAHGGNSGKRNCSRCSDHKVSLEEQVFADNGKAEDRVAGFPHVITPTGEGGYPPQTVFQIRTSYLDKGASEYRWNISKGTIVRSLQLQTNQDFKIQLICNKSDPLREEKLAEYSKIAPTTLADEDWYNRPHDGAWRRITRVDDDDILSVRFVELLNATPFDRTECILTFPTGAFYDGEKTYQWEYPENQFLTLQTNTSLTPYHFHHVDYRLRMPTVVIAPDVHWLWIRHSGVMSGAKPGRIHRRYKTKPMDIDPSLFPHFSVQGMKESGLLDTTTRFTESLRSKFGPFDVTVKNICAFSYHDHLSDLAAKYGTDKGLHGKGQNHQYTVVYNRLFSPIREDVTKVLEFGVGDGASLRMWSDYFPNAKIDGLDKSKTKVNHDRVATHTFKYHEKNLDPRLRYDIIIDDADHVSSHQRKAFEMHSSLVNPGGFYVIEDLCACRMNPAYVDEPVSMLQTCREWVLNPPDGWSCMLYGDQLCVLQKPKE